MEAALALAEDTWGPVCGVIHAAGTADRALMALYERKAAHAALAAKVEGTNVLVELLGDRNLDFVLLCGSINASVGFVGSASYAAANAYLDTFVLSGRRPAGWRALCIAWDVWKDVGMASAEMHQTAGRQEQLKLAIAPEDGIEAFSRAFAAGDAQFLVSPFDMERGVRLLRVRRSRTTGSSEKTPKDARQIVPTPRSSASVLTAPFGDIETQLASVWEDLLGVTPIGVHDNFFELGGHSLLATRVLARVDSFFGVRLPLRAIFEAPTIRQLGELIATRPGEAGADVAMAPVGEREEFEL